ncbi:MAG: response regulator transcription factor, partial [Acidobacteria bacterium]|nr:response regulator transcription factor [Acidobacteriota bacterium]
VIGYGTEEIADRLMISPNTVRSHISQCLQKLDAHSRVEAVGVARRLDLV